MMKLIDKSKTKESNLLILKRDIREIKFSPVHAHSFFLMPALFHLKNLNCKWYFLNFNIFRYRKCQILSFFCVHEKVRVFEMSYLIVR